MADLVCLQTEIFSDFIFGKPEVIPAINSQTKTASRQGRNGKVYGVLLDAQEGLDMARATVETVSMDLSSDQLPSDQLPTNQGTFLACALGEVLEERDK